MGGMAGHGSDSEIRGAVTQVLIAMAIVFVAFRVADVAPIRTEGPVAPPEAPYVTLIRAVDEALDQGDATAAERAWHEAYRAGRVSWGWEGLVAAGDAARRIGEVAGPRLTAEARARTAYLAAFFRARQAGAIAGMLRAADAFAALGDDEVAERCRAEATQVTARGIARDDGQAVVSRVAR